MMDRVNIHVEKRQVKRKIHNDAQHASISRVRVIHTYPTHTHTGLFWQKIQSTLIDLAEKIKRREGKPVCGESA